MLTAASLEVLAKTCVFPHKATNERDFPTARPHFRLRAENAEELGIMLK
jgi:hypothetical protein